MLLPAARDTNPGLDEYLVCSHTYELTVLKFHKCDSCSSLHDDEVRWLSWLRCCIFSGPLPIAVSNERRLFCCCFICLVGFIGFLCTDLCPFICKRERGKRSACFIWIRIWWVSCMFTVIIILPSRNKPWLQSSHKAQSLRKDMKKISFWGRNTLVLNMAVPGKKKNKKYCHLLKLRMFKCSWRQIQQIQLHYYPGWTSQKLYSNKVIYKVFFFNVLNTAVCIQGQFYQLVCRW